MKATPQTNQQIERVIKKLTQKFPSTEEPTLLTDIHLRLTQESGELLFFDDDDNEITRCVIDEWIDNKESTFFDDATDILRRCFQKNSKEVDNWGILKPYSVVLEDEEGEFVGELYMADDDTFIFGGDLMKGLDEDLDKFLKDLFKDE
jgi:hypothetical protein